MEFIGKCLVVEEKGERILVVGDLHLGYEQSLNESGVLVGRKMYEEMIEYIDGVFARVGGVGKVVLLGDVKHEFGSILGQEWRDVGGLIDYFEGKMGGSGGIVIVKGNHDKIIDPIARKRNVEVLDFFVFGRYCFVHGDREFEEMYGKGVKVWVMGHGHPAVKISDGVKVEKFKCFLVGKYKGKEIVIAPSFFDYIEGSDPRENDLGMAWDFRFGGFGVRAVEGFEVLDFGKLGKL